MGTITRHKRKVENLVDLSDNQKLFSAFLNTISTTTNQRDFYNMPEEQLAELKLIHENMLAFNRELYAYMMMGIANDFNKQFMIVNLLKNSATIADKNYMKLENWLILQTLETIPPHRAYNTFSNLEKVGCSRRVKYISKTLLTDIIKDKFIFHSVKYKRKIKQIIYKSHMNVKKINPEVWAFLYDQPYDFTEELYINYRQAKTSKEAALKLDYSIAVGFKKLHGLTDEEILNATKKTMTNTQKALVQNKAAKSGAEVDVDPSKLNLFKLLIYLRENPTNLSDEEKKNLINTVANREAKKIMYSFNKIAIVADNSQSMYGSKQKAYHPITSVQLAIEILKQISQECTVETMHDDGVILTPKGESNIASGLIRALKKDVEYVFILSDGYENKYEGATQQVISAYDKLDGKANIVQLNPVFAAETKGVKSLDDRVETHGFRNENDLNNIFFLVLMKGNLDVAIELYARQLKKLFKYADRLN